MRRLPSLAFATANISTPMICRQKRRVENGEVRLLQLFCADIGLDPFERINMDANNSAVPELRRRDDALIAIALELIQPGPMGS